MKQQLFHKLLHLLVLRESQVKVWLSYFLTDQGVLFSLPRSPSFLNHPCWCCLEQEDLYRNQWLWFQQEWSDSFCKVLKRIQWAIRLANFLGLLSNSSRRIWRRRRAELKYKPRSWSCFDFLLQPLSFAPVNDFVVRCDDPRKAITRNVTLLCSCSYAVSSLPHYSWARLGPPSI